MKKLIVSVSIILLTIACEKGERVTPVKTINLSSNSFYFDTLTNSLIQPSANSRIDLCYIQTQVIKYFCYGHTWKFKYYLGDSDSAFVVPGLINASLGANTAVWASNGAVKEYTYENIYFNEGTLLIDSCGRGFHVNTLFLQDKWFKFDEFKLTISKGKIVKVTFKGKVIGVRVEGIRVD